MTYRVGNIEVAFRGDSPASRDLQQNLTPLGSDSSAQADLEFHFVDRLPRLNGPDIATIGRFRIGERNVQIHESLWHYDVSAQGARLKVLVAPRPESAFEARLHDLKKSWRYLHMFGTSGRLCRVRGFVFSGYVPLVQLALLSRQSTFCHSSAIERNGEAILFPAWGGTGKTGLMSRYVAKGWNFLADDLCVLQSNGRASIHPLPLHIYRYHEVQCGELVDRLLAQAQPFDRRLWKICRTVKRPNKLVRWVHPSRIFGEERLSLGGQVTKVFCLHRTHESDLRLERLEPDELATRIASNLFDEIPWPPQLAVAVRSCRSLTFVPEVGRMYEQIRQTCLSAFERATCYSVGIPQQAVVADVQTYLDGKRAIAPAA